MKKGLTDYQKKTLSKYGLKPDPKGVSFFVTYQGRHCGRKKITRYLKLLEDGTVITIDVTRNKISTLKGFGSMPLMLDNSTRTKWDKAYKQVTSTFK